MAQSIEDLILGTDDNVEEQSVVNTGQVSTEGYTPSVEEFITLGGSEVQKTEAQLEQGMIPILKGLPDNGRILQDPKTKKLFYRSAGYATGNQDEVKAIIDNLRQGEDVAPTQEAISRGKQWFFDKKAPKQVSDYYGIPESVAQPATRAGLLGQQFLSGIGAKGSYFDEYLTDTPQEKQRYERIRQDFESEYPVQATTAQLAGLGTSIYGAGQAFGGATDKFKKLSNVVDNAKKWYQSLPPLGQRAVQVGGTSLGAGVEGLIYGAGKGDTSDERLVSAGQQGFMNTAITAPIAIAFPLVGNLINRFKPAQQQVEHIATEFGIGIESARMLREAFESGTSLGEMIKQVERSGNEAMMVDATKAFERLLDASKGSSAGMTQKVDSAITGRVEQKSSELQSDIDKTLGVKPEGTTTIIEQVGKSSAGARGDAYAKAYDHVVDYKSTVGQKIKSVLNRVDPTDMKEAITEANKMLRDKGLTQFQVMARFDEFGNLSLEKDLNFVQLDYIKRGLDTLGTKIDNIGQPTPSAVRSQGQSRDLRNAMVEGNPAYGDALALGQGKIKTQQAIVLGSKLLNPKTTLDDVKRMVSKASKDEFAGAKQGIREQIENIMSNAKTASGQGTEQAVKEAMTAVTAMSSRANQNKLRLILGDKTADAMFKRLDEVKKSLEVQTGVRLGSPTAPRQEIYKQVDEMIKGGGIKSFFSGDPKTSITKMRDFLTGTGEHYYADQRAKIFNELATILTSPKIVTKTKIDGKSEAIQEKTIKQTLEYLSKVSAGETLTKPQASFVVKHIKNALESQGFAFGVGVESQRQGVGQ